MNKGFTLVELAIVIVIIGLLIGGVLQGQELIKQSQIRKIISDINGYNSAIATFYRKYNAIAGDMVNASDFWGEVSSGCTTQTGTGTQTCNGNGDKIVDYDRSATATWESWRFWQHLSNAGLIKGSFTGATGSCSQWCYQGNKNVPLGPTEGSIWAFWYLQSSWGFTGKYISRHVFALSKPAGTITSWYNPSLTPSAMHEIDLKIDDGKPYTGIMVNFNFTNTTNCTSTGSSSIVTSATYNIEHTQIACLPLIDSSMSF